ncbi:hypothetical protein [Haloarchaeobius sp. HRN-SO-5]|uniref:DUF5789 family protein n=1 Tax=Haloarchaeobius sp. HRN-SO-5 TaxID=3446118 RepID=UPI003EBCE820
MGDDSDSVDDAARERQHERAERVADVLASVREDLGTQQYPVSSEELATEYADRPMDLPNETESLGSVFDRLDGEFEDEEMAFEAVTTEIDAGGHVEERSDLAAGGPPYRDSGRDRREAESVDDEFYDSTPERARERASEAQAAEYEDDEEDERSGTE